MYVFYVLYTIMIYVEKCISTSCGGSLKKGCREGAAGTGGVCWLRAQRVLNSNDDNDIIMMGCCLCFFFFVCSRPVCLFSCVVPCLGTLMTDISE